jgi:hypothetical protein
MFGLGFLAFVAITVLLVYVAGRIAREQGRSVPLWMLATALFGPIPVVILLFLPKRPTA